MIAMNETMHVINNPNLLKMHFQTSLKFIVGGGGVEAACALQHVDHPPIGPPLVAVVVAGGLALSSKRVSRMFSSIRMTVSATSSAMSTRLTAR